MVTRRETMKYTLRPWRRDISLFFSLFFHRTAHSYCVSLYFSCKIRPLYNVFICTPIVWARAHFFLLFFRFFCVLCLTFSRFILLRYFLYEYNLFFVLASFFCCEVLLLLLLLFGMGISYHSFVNITIISL